MGLKCSKAIALVAPVVPIGDSKPSALIGAKRHKLGKGDDDLTLAVLRSHKDGKAAQLVMSESGDANLFAGTKRRSGHGLTYPRFEWKAQAFFEMAVPRHRAFFFGVCVDNDLHRDALFALVVNSGLCHERGGQIGGLIGEVHAR